MGWGTFFLFFFSAPYTLSPCLLSPCRLVNKQNRDENKTELRDHPSPPSSFPSKVTLNAGQVPLGCRPGVLADPLESWSRALAAEPLVNGAVKPVLTAGLHSSHPECWRLLGWWCRFQPQVQPRFSQPSSRGSWCSLSWKRNSKARVKCCFHSLLWSGRLSRRNVIGSNWFPFFFCYPNVRLSYKSGHEWLSPPRPFQEPWCMCFPCANITCLGVQWRAGRLPQAPCWTDHQRRKPALAARWVFWFFVSILGARCVFRTGWQDNRVVRTH